MTNPHHNKPKSQTEGKNAQKNVKNGFQVKGQSLLNDSFYLLHQQACNCIYITKVEDAFFQDLFTYRDHGNSK